MCVNCRESREQGRETIDMVEREGEREPKDMAEREGGEKGGRERGDEGRRRRVEAQAGMQTRSPW